MDSSKPSKTLFPRRALIHTHKASRLSPEPKSSPLGKSPYMLQHIQRPSPNGRSRSLKAKNSNQRGTVSFYPPQRQIAMIYTHHRPTRERQSPLSYPRRSSSLKPISPTRPEAGLKLHSTRPESLSSSMELASDSLTDESQKLCRSEGRSLLLPSASPPSEPDISFVKTVFPAYELGSIHQLFQPEATPSDPNDTLRFIQEVQASMEHSDDDSDSFSKGIGCTEEEFRIRATFSSSQPTGETSVTRARSNRAPYKKLSLVGLMPLEDLWEQKPGAGNREKRERAKTYTGAGGFTVSTKRTPLIPEIEYGLCPSSPIRPFTQLSKSKRPRSFYSDITTQRPLSTTAQTSG